MKRRCGTEPPGAEQFCLSEIQVCLQFCKYFLNFMHFAWSASESAIDFGDELDLEVFLTDVCQLYIAPPSFISARQVQPSYVVNYEIEQCIKLDLHQNKQFLAFTECGRSREMAYSVTAFRQQGYRQYWVCRPIPSANERCRNRNRI